VSLVYYILEILHIYLSIYSGASPITFRAARTCEGERVNPNPLHRPHPLRVDPLTAVERVSSWRRGGAQGVYVCMHVCVLYVCMYV